MEKVFIIHTKDGIKRLTENDAIKNAMYQESCGIVPHYAFYNYEKTEPVTRPGWLVWSTCCDGCGVVYRREDGKPVLITGMQSEFCYM